MKDITVSKAPCGSCPYRKDVPSGIWHSNEYEKLPSYDGSMAEQALDERAHGIFMCHQNDGKLCAGWVGCHGPNNLLALRLHSRIARAVFTYKSPVTLWSSGKEACAHGKRAIKRPSVAARRMVGKLVRKLSQGRRT